MIEPKRVESVRLRDLGLNEKWLQERVQRDPSILGLGELEVAGREHRQPVGGRIDFLLRHLESDLYYEVELMLGAVDESHIIRTIEYWDVERQRRPKAQHKAVIVAEEINARFFNVIRLLNRSVPLIAIKLSAFKTEDGNVVLWPITVLDTIDEVSDDEVAPVEAADRAYWERKSPHTLECLDQLVGLMEADQSREVRVTYNRHHIAVGTTGRNFCWFYQRKPPKCRIELKVDAASRDKAIAELVAAGVEANAQGDRNLNFSVTATEIKGKANVLVDILSYADEASRD